MVRFPVFNSVMMCEYHFAKGYIYVKHMLFFMILNMIYIYVLCFPLSFLLEDIEHLSGFLDGFV